uniref:Uncharacterized protein n=1 Tax=Rhizophora mucronata TaxID=61149 RepID=A0A2P2QVJ3_RHIMU
MGQWHVEGNPRKNVSYVCDER